MWTSPSVVAATPVRLYTGCSPNGHLFSFDQDADAEQNVLEPEQADGTTAGPRRFVDDDRFTFVRSNFRYLRNWMRYYGIEHIDGLLADLGVSSHHFDDESRGFSFRFDAPLDMRMNKRGGATAADLVNNNTEEQLADIFYLYGGAQCPTHRRRSRQGPQCQTHRHHP